MAADKCEEEEDLGSASSDSFINDSENDEPSTSGQDDGVHLEQPLTDEDIERLISELLTVESKAAEAQEALEDESLAKVEVEVRDELAQSLEGEELENAVVDEMLALREKWEDELDDLETESAHLLEQLDGAGIELPSLYKWIESQAPNGCCTEAWKNRTHWVGSNVTNDATESIADADKYLQTHRPVKRHHGKLLEEGASGFLQKRLAPEDDKESNKDVNWSSFNELCSSSSKNTSFGSKNWASVYLASTPQQAAELGLNFPGVDEVEEIDDIEGSLDDPFVAAAVVTERELYKSEDHKNIKKVKEEDDVNIDRKLLSRLNKKRQKKKLKQKGIKEAEEEDDISNDIANHRLNANHKTSSNGVHAAVLSGSKRSSDSVEQSDSKKCRTDVEHVAVDGSTSPCSESETNDQSDHKGNGDANSPSGSSDEEFCCTACDKVANEVHTHPLLKVIVCRNCKYRLDEKMKETDPECSECFCGWCGKNGDLVSCKSCKNLFCTSCIKKNLGEEYLLKAQESSWQCCCCTPSILQSLTSQLQKAFESRSESSSSSSESDSDDSDDSDDNIKVPLSKRRRKKKIRRILDDTELGEDTKKKIAIEKERQERLKSLEAERLKALKSMKTNYTSFRATVSDGTTVKVLGDAQTGYIVNVVREENEEAVRLPPSISIKLKSHQVAGIRFLWENIIQSITKVRSGDKGLGCILAHTMGLGKTLQVIAFLYAAMRSVDIGLKAAMIVTPVNVLHNWRHEFTKWRPTEFKPIRVYMLEDVPRDRRLELLMKWRSKGGVFLIGYTNFRNLSLGKHIKDRHMAKEFCRTLQDGPDILVCDEAHMIKNTRADTTQALKQVKCQRRIALTGSPLQNNLMEYYCMVDFVREGFLGSSQEFRNRFQNPIENGQHTNSTTDDVKIMNQRSHILYEQLKGFVQRMDMNVVKKDLPPKTVFVIAVKLSPMQRVLYKKFLDVHGLTEEKASQEKTRKSFFASYQALAQIWNHPGILQLMKDRNFGKRENVVENFLEDSSSDENLDYTMANGDKIRNRKDQSTRKKVGGFFKENWWGDLLQENGYDAENSGKIVLLLDILTLCSDAGDKALVFSQSLATLDMIERHLSKLPRKGKSRKCWKQGKDWYRLDGRTEGSERQKLVEKFNDPSNKRVKCTLISTRAGSLGINLYAANRVIIVDGSWNPTYDLQAIYRAWRYGQTKPVFAYRLMAHGTMEEKIYKRQVTKESLSARVVDRQQVHRTISKEEMLHLFAFGDDESLNTSYNKVDQLGGNAATQFNPLLHATVSSDKFMEVLLSKHHPKWIANYHEHESLLQENEDEKLSKEEQDMAWEVYRRTLEWEEVQRNPVEGPTPVFKPTINEVEPEPEPEPEPRTKKPPRCTRVCSRDRFVLRKCTNLAHMLTLRSQGVKQGCTTICGECGQEISWNGVK